MSKKTIYGLILIGLVVIVLIANTRGLSAKVDVNLILTEITAIKSLVFLGFAAIGVVIGVLLK